MKQFIKNIGKIALSLSCFGLLLTNAVAQTQNPGNNLWTFPPNYTDQQNVFTFLPEGPNAGQFGDYDGSVSNNAHNIMRDINGDILFFVVDDRVFDNQGRLIDKMHNGGDIGQIKGATKKVILPDPSNCQRYYIFSTGRVNYTGQSSKKPFYSIVDLTAENIYDNTRDGALVLTNTGTVTPIASITPGFFGSSNPGENNAESKFGNVFFAATEENCYNERFVFVSTKNGIFLYILDENGVSYNNQFIPFQLEVTYNQIKMRSGMEVVQLPNDNYRIAVGHDAFENNLKGTGLFTAELDDQGVLIPNSQQSFFLSNDGVGTIETQAYIHGLEFSPDGSILYVTHNTNNNNPDPIEYVDFDNPGIGLQPLNVPNAQDFEMSQMEIDIDGDLVLVTENRIAALTNPNNPDPNNWDNSKIEFDPNSSYLPNDESTFTTNPTIARAMTSYIFPDQVGGMDYTEHLTSNLECLCICEVDDNSTWSPGVNNNPFGSSSGDVYIDGELTIPAGSNIQINDMTFYFTPGSKLIVERGNDTENGARLTLVNTTLTVDDICFEDAMWNGVQVQGYSTENQFPLSNTKQGWFRMYNDSRIEHAYIGIATHIYTSQSTYPFRPGAVEPNSTGGIVQVSNSTFLNNVRDILLYGYNAPNGQDNLFRATNSAFTTDGLLNDPIAYPVAHVTTFSNVGIDLFGNDYINYTPDLYIHNRQGTGVLAINSQIKIKARCEDIVPIGTPCPNYDRSEFRDLFTGVSSFSSVSGRKTTIERSLFINNYRGAFLGNDDYAEVTRNDFEVLRSAAPNVTFETYGLLLRSCDGYQVEENTFTEFNDPDATAPGNTYGVIVAQSGTNDNMIYRNEFFDLKIGSQAQGINGYDTEANNPTLIQGLQFKCNDYYNDIHEADIAVTSGLIRREQGDCDPSSSAQATVKPAGNKFSHSTFTPTNDIAVNEEVVIFEYAHHADLFTTPLNYNVDKVALNYCASQDDPVFYDEDKSCPSKIIEPGVTIGFNQFLSRIRIEMDSLQEVADEKERLIDNDQTQFLLGLIETGTTGEVKETLLEISPYLSDEVLIAYINSNPPNGPLKEVLLANSSLSDNVLEAMESINVSNGVMNQINDAQVGKSERDRLVSSFNYDRTERTLLLNQAIRFVLEDTVVPGRLDTVAVLLKNEQHQRKKEQLCDVYLCDRKLSEFDSKRSSIENEFGHNNYIRMADMNELLTEEIGAFKLDTLKTDNALRQEVEDVATDQNDRINTVRGEALLTALQDSLFHYVIEPLLSNNANKSMATGSNKQAQQLREMKLFPNPSNGNIVTVEIDAEAYNDPTIEVVDLTGKRVANYAFDNNKVKITTTNFKAGIYFVKLNDNGRFVETQKLIIQ